jgi:hypothetical protein
MHISLSLSLKLIIPIFSLLFITLKIKNSSLKNLSTSKEEKKKEEEEKWKKKVDHLMIKNMIDE